MRDEDRPKKQILTELEEMRRRCADLESAETDRRAALEALQASEMKFRSVAQSAVDAIISIDANDAVVFWNQGAKDIFGYTEEEVLGRPVAMLIPERYQDAHRRGIERFLATRRPVLIGQVAELKAVRKGGIEFPIELSLSTWSTKDGTFFTGIIRDISGRTEARKALEQRTEEARQRTGELESLIQMVAHDLKSPVISIVGLVRALKSHCRNLPSDEQRDRILDQLTSSGETMEKFLKELLDGLVSEHSEPVRDQVAMDRAIRDSIHQHHQTIEERGIRIEVEIAPDLPRVWGDHHRIRQIIDNILINATRHMGDRTDPRIKIEVREYRESVLTSISDNGVGIPGKYLRKVFDRFFRVPTPGAQPGTGLGLSIAKKIVESHGGQIWAESKEGHGTTFSFTLPKSKPC
ncbi:MAG: PAS domain S-box protein [Desulfomonile tiedjei]|nr:PAS domain S-box protein [Desulfomonile tiedjei]